MSLLSLIVVFVVVGIVLWLINVYIPMDANIKRLLNIAVVIFMIFWLLTALGLLGSLSNVRVP